MGRLCNNAALAADKLVALLDSEQDHVAYAAAKSILELGTKLREAGEIEQRIRLLETHDTQEDRVETEVVYDDEFIAASAGGTGKTANGDTEKNRFQDHPG